MMKFRLNLFLPVVVIMSLYSASGLGCGLQSAAIDDWGGVERYASDNAALMATRPVDPDRVVLLGNSITEGWPSARPDFFTANNLVGRGISGHTSYQYLVRFREDVINLRPLAVVINVATNDIAENTCPYDEERTFGNLLSMVELAEANGIKVILSSVLPASGFKWRPALGNPSGKIEALNKRIREYARRNNIPYVDYHAALADPATGGMREGTSRDGVHPTPAGYEVMESILLPVIENIRKSNK